MKSDYQYYVSLKRCAKKFYCIPFPLKVSSLIVTTYIYIHIYGLWLIDACENGIALLVISSVLDMLQKIFKLYHFFCYL